MSDVEFEAAYLDRERASVITKLSQMVDPSLLERDSNAYKRMTPKDRFLISADAITRSLNNKFDKLNLDEKNITEILSYTELTNIEYKNPCGWVLGYIVSRNQSDEKSGGVDIEMLKYVIDEVLDYANNSGDKLANWSVTPPDVIRYTRFWISLMD